MTNGEKIKELFPSFDVEDKTEYFGRVRNLDDHFIKADIEWWNAEYKEPTTKNDKVDCEHTDCNNCVNHKYCDYESNNSTTKNDLGVDCISRQTVIDAIAANCIWENEYNLTSSRIKKAVEKLPSVTPQEPILDKIRAEIAEIQLIGYATVDGKREIASRAVLQIIDKYKAESEDKNE